MGRPIRMEGIVVQMGADWRRYADSTPEGFEPFGTVLLPGKKATALFIQGERVIAGETELDGLDLVFTLAAIRKAISAAENYALEHKWKKPVELVVLTRKAQRLTRQIECDIDRGQFESARELSHIYNHSEADLIRIIEAMNAKTIWVFLMGMGPFAAYATKAIRERIYAIKEGVLK